MKLKTKALLAITVSFLGLFLVNQSLFSSYVLRDFRSIEDDILEKDASRFAEALEAERKQMGVTIMDWAQWDDLYNFMAKPNDEFKKSWSTYESYKALRIAHTLFFDAKRKFVLGYEVNFQNEEVKEVDKLTSFYQQISQQEPFFDFEGSAIKAGLVRISSQLWLVASSPILDSERLKPSRGTLLIMKLIDPRFVQKLAAQTRLTVNAVKPTSFVGMGDVAALNEGTIFVQPQDDDLILVRLAIKDIYNNLQLVIRILEERPIFNQGQRTSEWLWMTWLLASLAAIFLANYLLDRFVLRRLNIIGKQVELIRLTRSFEARVTEQGKDELFVMAHGINSMLDALSSAQHEVAIARDAADAANRAKSMFVAKVSHELRTPIHSIVGMLRILFREETSASKRSYIRMARDAAYNLLSTINDILDFSKVESGNLTLEKVSFSLRECVRDAVRVVAPRAEEKGSLEIICSVDSSIPDGLVGDPLRFKQVLVNLLGNSIKFTPSGFIELKIATLDLTRTEVSIRVCVKDTGVGISADRLPFIFEPFTQADESVARLFQGTGLGLTIVKQLIEGMGGKVSVVSEIGVGTTFSLEVPFCLSPDSSWALPDLEKYSPAMLIDKASYSAQNLKNYFASQRASLAFHDVSDDANLIGLSNDRSTCKLIIVTGEALKKSKVFNFVVETAASGRRIEIIAILSPFEISLRERLAALNIKKVVTRPALPEDLILACDNLLDIDCQNWDESLEAVAITSRRLRVLIADDAQTNRIILQSMLEEAGHVVETVADGAELIYKIDPSKRDDPDFQFDVVFTDVQMPIIDGLTASRHIREKEENFGVSRIPIIAVTAHAFAEEKSKMLEAGIDEVLTKPIEPAEMSRVLLQLTGEGESHKILSPVDPQGVKLDLGIIARKVWEQFVAQGVVDVEPKAVTEILEVPIELGNAQSIESILDINDVYNRSGESSRRTLLIFKAFLTSFADVLGQCASAKSNKDINALEKAAHSLKGLLLDIGARNSGEFAGSLERMCKAGELDKASKLITALTNQTLTVARVVERIVEVATASGAINQSLNRPVENLNTL